MQADDNYVRKTREDMEIAFQACLTKVGVSQMRLVAKCMLIDFGLFDETAGFNIDRLVKQFGDESVRPIVVKCVDKNPNGDISDVWVHRVMNCLRLDNLKIYNK